MPESPPLRRIRSFVRRGRLTDAQARALRQLLPAYRYRPDDPALRPDRALYLEIGFGNGHSLVEMAAANPDACFLGIEVHRAGIGRLLLEIERQRLDNIRVLDADATEILQRRELALSFDGIYLLFPDPWPKKKHHKRRILTAEFARHVAAHLKPGGYFYIATDWQEYAESIVSTLQGIDGLQPVDDVRSIPGFIPRPSTKYEQRGRRLQHSVYDLVYRKTPAAAA